MRTMHNVGRQRVGNEKKITKSKILQMIFYGRELRREKKKSYFSIYYNRTYMGVDHFFGYILKDM